MGAPAPPFHPYSVAIHPAWVEKETVRRKINMKGKSQREPISIGMNATKRQLSFLIRFLRLAR